MPFPRAAGLKERQRTRFTTKTNKSIIALGNKERGGYMKHCYDHSGEVFGRLTAIRRVPKPENSVQTAWWLCKCLCGKEVIVSANHLTMGQTQSCGCFAKERLRERLRWHNSGNGGHKTHGCSRTRLYKLWIGIRGRCNTPSYSTYPYYGGKGIKVAEEWDKKFEPFMEWSYANGYTDKHTIDRIDIAGNYTPQNCRWVSKSIQAYNQGMSKNNKSGVKGVVHVENRGKYIATIGYHGDHIYLGSFDTIKEAATARKDAEIRYYGDI
jgi:hypothetical protein